MRHRRAAFELLPGLPLERAEADLLVHLCQRLLLFGGLSLGQTLEESNAQFERGVRTAEHHADISAQVRLSAYANALLTRGRLSEFLQPLARERPTCHEQ